MSNQAIQLRIYIEQGMEHFERGEIEDAFLWWDRALRIDPKNTHVRQLLDRLPPRRPAPSSSPVPPLPPLPHPPSPSSRPAPSSPLPGFRPLHSASPSSSLPPGLPPHTRPPSSRPLPPDSLLTPHPAELASSSHRTEEEIAEVWLPQEDDLSWDPPASSSPSLRHPPSPPAFSPLPPASPGRFSPPPSKSSYPPAMPSGPLPSPSSKHPTPSLSPPPPLPTSSAPTPSEMFELRRIPFSSSPKPTQAPAQSLDALTSRPPTKAPPSGPSFPPSGPSYPRASTPASTSVPSLSSAPSLPPTPPAEDTEILLSTARELLQISDLEGALELVEIILKREPKHAEALAILQQSQSQLSGFYLQSVGSLQARPSMRCSFEQILHQNLNHREGFLLSQIDGRTSISDLIVLSGMSEFAILKLLHRLILQGILKV